MKRIRPINRAIRSEEGDVVELVSDAVDNVILIIEMIGMDIHDRRISESVPVNHIRPIEAIVVENGS